MEILKLGQSCTFLFFFKYEKKTTAVKYMLLKSVRSILDHLANENVFACRSH